MHDQHISSIMRIKVTTVDRGMKVSQVVQEMTAKNIGAVVVTVDGIPVGIFSERDLLKRVIARGVSLEQTPVHMVMSPKLLTVGPTETIGAVGYMMHHNNVRHIPVLLDGKLAGMVSIRDVLGALLGINEGGEAFDLE